MLLTYEHTMFADTGTIHEKAFKKKSMYIFAEPKNLFRSRCNEISTDGDEPDIVHTTPP